MNKATPGNSISAKTAGSPVKGDLHSSIAVLPVMAAQLRQVAQHVEESVVKVCGCFQDMIQRARQATAQVPHLADSQGEEDHGGQMGINHLISEMRGTMGDLLQRIEHTSSFSGLMVDRLNQIEGQIEGLTETLGDIDEVASKSRLLALNGQLEAARAGEQGAAFAIVATETAKMAVHAVSSSKKIRKMIGSIAESIHGASAELKQRAATDIRDTALSREEVNHSLDDMSTLHDDMQKTIEQSHSNNEQLARDISDAVMTLQFQDAVNQRIDHVVQILLEMHRSLEEQSDCEAADVPPREISTAAKDWTDRMARSYTMAAEHQVLASAGLSSCEHKAGCGSNVELF